MLTDIDDYRRWIEELTGMPVSAFERLSIGASRGMYIVKRGQAEDLILRVDSGAGPFAGTELTLAREAEVYRALSGQPVPIARFEGATPDGSALLMGRVSGTHDLATLAEAERIAICDQFMDALAALHRIDTEPLDLPSFHRPLDTRDHAIGELDLWERIFRQRVVRPAPLVHCAFAILRDLAPAYAGPTVLCHGDVGPRNFMFERGRITALIDWEIAHLGDPMDDLAWWVFRGHEWLGAAGSLPDQLHRWSRASGIPLSAARIAYYRAVLLLRWQVMILGALDNGDASVDRFPYLSLVAVLDIKLSCALADLARIDIGDFPDPLPAAASADLDVIDILSTDVRDHIIPALAEPEALRRAAAVLSYAAHLAARARFATGIDAADLADLSQILGRTPDEIDTGERQLTGTARPADILRYAMRKGARHAELWPSTRARALTPPWSIASLGLEDIPAESAP